MKRRRFLNQAAGYFCALLIPAVLHPTCTVSLTMPATGPDTLRQPITLFFCGDVMTGRGIDQVLPCPSEPQIYEPYVQDARRYVKLAEDINGPIDSPVSFDYIWGDALTEFERIAPDLRIINLETSITTSDDYWTGKGINYRMHPHNIACLTAGHIDACVLANNHVLDWGYDGLKDTLRTLGQVRIKIAGAGVDDNAAQAPAIFEISGKGRVVIFALGHTSSGIPYSWRATKNRPGINLLEDLSSSTLQGLARQIDAVRKENDIVVASIHWGSNWGYRIPAEQSRFARRLIDTADVDVVHGHSSHHPRGIEIHRNRPILYGCGDFINDYEGIGGYEEYRGDLSLMYFITMDAITGELMHFELVPTQLRKFRIHHASRTDAQWLAAMLNREGKPLHSRIILDSDNIMQVVNI